MQSLFAAVMFLDQGVIVFTGDVTRVSVVPGKVTVKIGDAGKKAIKRGTYFC